MMLRDAIESYVAWRRSPGARFDSSVRMLHGFGRHVGESVGCNSVTTADVLGFLAGDGRLTRNRANKHGTLNWFGNDPSYPAAFEAGFDGAELPFTDLILSPDVCQLFASLAVR